MGRKNYRNDPVAYARLIRYITTGLQAHNRNLMTILSNVSLIEIIQSGHSFAYVATIGSGDNTDLLWWNDIKN